MSEILDIPSVQSRYKFTDISPTSFEISGADRRLVRVEMRGPQIVVWDVKEVNDFMTREREYGRAARPPSYLGYNYGLFNVHVIVRQCATTLMKEWKGKPSAHPTKSRIINEKIKTWAINKTARALAKRITNKWREMLLEADPTHIAVSRACFSATGKGSLNAQNPLFYNEHNKYEIQDIIKYRAAAMSADFLQLDNYGHSLGWSLSGQNEFYVNHWNNQNNLTDSWLKLYSINSEAYSSLNKTLMNIPGGIPIGILQNLKRIELKRPITTRKELIALLSARSRLHDNVFFRSSEADIKRCLKVYAGAMREKPLYRKTHYIGLMSTYATDFPEPHNGNLRGLLGKSLRWHRTARFDEIKNYYNYSPETPTIKPPIELPKNPNIQFLDTVASLVDEGSRQNHCVGTSGYLSKAVRGESYIFSVMYKDERATVEIDRIGRVVQAREKQNKVGVAAKYAQRELAKWAKGFRESEQESVYVGAVANEFDEFEVSF